MFTRFKGRVARRFGLLGLFAFTGACGNIFRNFPEKNSDTYRIDAARNHLDNNEYDDAIDQIYPVFENQPRNPEVVYLASAAFAGRAGLRILDLFDQIANASGSDGVLKIFAEHFDVATDQDLEDYQTAVGILEGYSDEAAARSTDLNFYAIFLYYSRIGLILNRYAYDSTGALKSNFEACHRLEVTTIGAPRTGIPNDDLDKIYISIPRIIEIIQNIALGSQFGSITDLGSLPALPKSPLPCSGAPNNVNCLAVRTLVNAGPALNGIGLGTGVGVCAVTTP